MCFPKQHLLIRGSHVGRGSIDWIGWKTHRARISPPSPPVGPVWLCPTCSLEPARCPHLLIIFGVDLMLGRDSTLTLFLGTSAEPMRACL